MKKILLIEDTKALAENMSDILENLGFEVMIASNGKEAIDRLPRFKPDLVITDVVMPVMSGIEFTERLRTMPGYREIPVIMLSARATAQDIQTGLRAGASQYLTKPCTVRVLVDSINKLLDR